MPKWGETLQQRYSVCIGINTHVPGNTMLAPLSYAEDDAIAVNEVLGTLGFPTEHRVLLLGKDATLSNINAALSEFILNRPKRNDLVVLYFSGHSFPRFLQDEESDIFLAHYDLSDQEFEDNPSFIRHQALSMTRLRWDFFESEGSHKILFVLDCSYSGALFSSGYRGYVQDIFNTTSTDRIALLSTSPRGSSRENAIFGHGLFTYHLLQGLSGKALAAVRSDGYLTVNTLFEYIADQLPSSQHPILGGVQQDPFVLAHYTKLAAIKHSLREKIANGDFDVFLCHNSKDKTLIKEIATLLKEQGILPWLDDWELRPGIPWQRVLEEQIERIKSAAVFVGEAGIGPWQQEELDAFLREFMERRMSHYTCASTTFS